ncbi:YxlC family protein [Paenibacillus sp. CN-4]|uniref:YxlC family protein n=1 Tax=Paenibacillus nanchangensis TaxID=3348343 RepID=UPI003977FC41
MDNKKSEQTRVPEDVPARYSGPAGEPGQRPGEHTGAAEKRQPEADGPDRLTAELVRQLERLDQVYADKAGPSAADLEWMISERRRTTKAKERKELVGFWVLSLLIMGGTTAVLTSSPALYLLIQGLIPVGALIWRLVGRSEDKRRWNGHE